MEQSKKIKLDKEFFVKYKTILMCAVCTIFYLLTPLSSVFIYIDFALVVVSGLLFNIQESFCIFAYTNFFTGLIYFKSSTHIAWSILIVAMFLRYLYLAIFKKEKVAKWPAIISGIFYLFSILPLWNYTNAWGLGLSLMFLIPLYLIYIYRDQMDAIKITYYLFAGLVISSLLGYFLYSLCGISIYNIVFYDKRYKFFTHNPNFYGLIANFIIAGFICAIFRRRMNWWTGLLCISVLTFLGTRTGSKAFLLAWCIIVGITMLILLFRNKKIGFIVVGCMAVFAVIAFFSFRSYFDYILARLFPEGEINVNSITTGRVEVWTLFLQRQFANPLNVIFGMGGWADIWATASFGPIDGLHSIYLEFFYFFGVVGVILFVLLILSYRYTTEKEKGKVKRFVRAFDVLPLMAILVIGMAEMVIFNPTSIVVPISMLYIYNSKKYVEVGSRELNTIYYMKKHKRVNKTKNLVNDVDNG